MDWKTWLCLSSFFCPGIRIPHIFFCVPSNHKEPLAMVMCGGALTSFHRVLPTATLGYAVIDLLDGMKLGLDFLSHGLVLLGFALYMCENEKNEILSTMLALEVRIYELNKCKRPRSKNLCQH